MGNLGYDYEPFCESRLLWGVSLLFQLV
jgi:hypothetical protein